jgi:hypothetical protein
MCVKWPTTTWSPFGLSPRQHLGATPNLRMEPTL